MQSKASKALAKSQPSTPNYPKSDMTHSVLDETRAKLEKFVRKKKDKKKFTMQMKVENGGDWIHLMKEKLAQSKHLDHRPDVKLIRRKVMKEMHKMKRHSKEMLGAKKRKKLNNLVAKL